MLYDPKWEKKTETKPSLAGLVAWLEKQNPEGRYKWSDCGGRCLIGLYGAAIGVPWDEMLKLDDSFSNIYMRLTCPSPDHVGIALKGPHTFGAALTRAREALASLTT